MASVDFINECKNYAYENRYGKLEFSNPTLELNQSNRIQEFSIDSGCYIDGNIIGSVYAKKLTAQLIDALDDTLENRPFNVSVGVKYDDESTEYIGLGSFVVEKPKDEQTANYTSLTAYDLLMQHLEEKYYSDLDYDNEIITIGDVYEELCNHLELTPLTTAFTNSAIVVEGNPFTNNETNRVVLNAIAKVACAFVDVDYDTNEIDLKWLSNSIDYTFQMSDYSTVDGGKTVYGPVNSLIIKNSAVDSENVSYDDDESIALNGEHQLVINEDYFLYTEEKRQEALPNIWNKVNGLIYTECTLTTLLGKPFLKVGSKIRIYLDTERYIDSYVLQHEFKFDGTFYSQIKCPVLTEQEIKTKQKATLVEKVRQTEIIVNKQDGTITQLSTNVRDLDTRENNNYQEITQKFDGYAPKSDIVTIQNSVTQLQTDTYTKTEINTKLTDGSVTKVQTVSGTFDENGMTYEKTNAQTKTTINEVGINTKRTSNNETILFAGYVDDNNTQYADYKGQTIVATENILVKNYLVVGSKSRFEDYEDGTGVFYIG